MSGLRGKVGSSGFIIGKALVLTDDEPVIARRKVSSPETEVKRFDHAVEVSKEEIRSIKEATEKTMGAEEAEVFEAHYYMLEDPELIDATRDMILNESLCAEFAFQEVTNKNAALLESLDDPYLSARAPDVRDIGSRVIRKLTGASSIDITSLSQPYIVVARELTPSIIATMDKENVLGFITETGSPSSHIAIMAKAFEIPAILGVRDLTVFVKQDDLLVLDADKGDIVVNPDEAVLQRSLARLKEKEENRRSLERFQVKGSTTLDGIKVRLKANMGTVQDLPLVKKVAAEGVGLFRTEFLFLDGTNPPTEEEQFAWYRQALQELEGELVIIRTLDVGGDKEIPYLNIQKEENPFLGLRAIRYCLKHRDIFVTQLRALLRASVYGPLGIMLPLITSLEEVFEAKAIIEVLKKDLRKEGIAFDEAVKVGIMVETPSAAVMADILARHVDFFSIGSNDLVQYTCAADRVNENTEHICDPLNPAVLRLLRDIVRAGREHGIAVGICGEIAGDPSLLPILIGLGLTEFSMSPGSLLQARQIVSSISFADAKKLADHIFALECATQIRSHLQQFRSKGFQIAAL